MTSCTEWNIFKTSAIFLTSLLNQFAIGLKNRRIRKQVGTRFITKHSDYSSNFDDLTLNILSFFFSFFWAGMISHSSSKTDIYSVTAGSTEECDKEIQRCKETYFSIWLHSQHVSSTIWHSTIRDNIAEQIESGHLIRLSNTTWSVILSQKIHYYVRSKDRSKHFVTFTIRVQQTTDGNMKELCRLRWNSQEEN